MKRKFLLIIILIILTLPSVFALFHKGFFQSDDGEWMVIRFSAFHQAFRDGQFPVRFLPRLNYGYGYPVANFLYPGFMYLSEPIKLLGFGFVNTIKIILGLSMVGAAVFTYLWLSKLFDRWASFFGALFYLYVPYHLYDIYTRGSVGEILALAVVPFVLWQIERKSLLWTAIGIGLLITSHNTLAILFLPLIVLYMLLDVYVAKEKGHIYQNLLSLLLGIGITAFFWIPAIFDLQYTVFSKISVSDYKQYFADIKLIGISAIAVFIFSIFLFISKKITLSKHRLTVLFLIIGIISLFFATSISLPLWNLLPVSFIQFPFRFLSVTILCATFLLACSLSVLPKRSRIIVSSLVIILTAISSQSFLQPKEFFDKGESFYATNEATTTVKNEYMPKWIQVLPLSHPANVIEASNATISNISVQSTKISYTIIPKDNATVKINKVYFPGWVIERDGKETYYNYPLDINLKNGIFYYKWGQGDNKQHEYKFYFTETPPRLLADILSLVSIIFLFALTLKRKFV